MTIRACLHEGRIQPLEPLPEQWVDGQELLIEPSESEEDLTYNPVPPLTSNCVDAVIEAGGHILPLPFEFNEE